MLSVVILIGVFIQFIVSPGLFYLSARLFKTKASVKRALMTWLALFGVGLTSLLVSACLKNAAIALMLIGIALVLTLWLPARLLQVGFWRGLGVLGASTILIVIVAFGVRAVAVEAFLVPLASMAPTILPGDRILVDKLTPRFVPPEVGDVIVYEVWEEPFRPEYRAEEKTQLVKSTYVKRIAGLPDDIVTVHNGLVYVNDQPVGEDMAEHRLSSGGEPFQGRIPEGMMYLVGDNKEMSKDSRILGTVPLSTIKGKAVMIYASVVVDMPWLRQGRMADDLPDWYRPDDPPGRVRWERICKVIH